MNLQPLEQFLEKLQMLDMGKKRQILFGSTAAIMVVVVYVWIAYFNNILTTTSAEVTAATLPSPASQVAVQTQNAPGFFVRMENGMAYLFGTVEKGVAGFANTLKGPREYVIHP